MKPRLVLRSPMWVSRSITRLEEFHNGTQPCSALLLHFESEHEETSTLRT